ncbi:hypothetical protein ABGB18_42515 [Nonomuraea sp. B12E4]|uniref:ATP-binding protein n=1 Tax=Nonomuraea sp. B12E4 TaxID=3153564 RepID=UPI00325E713D
MTTPHRPKLELVRNGDDAPDLPLSEEHKELALQEAGGELEPSVIDGEIVSEEPDRSVSLPSVVVDKVMIVRPSPGVQKAARTTVQHGALVLAGWHSWIVRMYDALTMGAIREQIRIARTVGDKEALAEWIDRRDQARDRRHDRLMRLPVLALRMVMLAGGCLVGVPVVLVIVATVVWITGAGDWPDVWVWFGGVLRWLFGAMSFAWSVLVAASPLLLVWAGHRAGARRSEPPRWLATALGGLNGHDRRQVMPDEGAIVQALQHLGISPLNKAFKEGWRPRVVLGTGRDGKGWRTQLELPPGVTVDMINQKKQVLAHNLVRLPVEVWPTEPKSQPGVLDLWVADQGSLTGKVPDWPLLKDGTADYFKGVPVSINIRGTTVIGGLSQKNYAIAGMMGSGKSTMILTLLLGAILDPLPEIDVFVFATNADYDPLKPRLRTLLTGPGDEVVEACLFLLRDVYADLTVRGKALQEHGQPFVTRELAEKDERLRPRIIVIDECQALFLNETLGEEAEDLCVKLLGAARKYAVTLIFATPEPSSDSLPRKLMAVISNKACFAIGDQTSNDAVLGTGSYKQGISAVGLEPKTEDGPGDIGTCMARGFQGKPGLLRTYYVPYDEMKGVVARAMQVREKLGIGPAAASAAVQARDLLEDLSAVMGADPIPVADLPALLARHAPAWLPYKTLTGVKLREQLADLGVKVPTTGNRFPVHPEEVRAALARRSENDGEAG